MNDEFYNQLMDEAKPHFEDSVAHNIEHTKNVLKNAIGIAEVEGGDLEIVKAAAILHDIAKHKEYKKETECHAKEGAKMAEEILRSTDFPEEKIENVCHAIKVHRSSQQHKPETKEAKILQDADRLDCLGVQLIMRYLVGAGKYNIPIYDPKREANKKEHWSKAPIINQMQDKLINLTPKSFNTTHGKKLAKEKHEFALNFVNKFISEQEKTI